MTQETTFAPLAVEWAIEAHQAFCPNAEVPSRLVLKTALKAIDGCTTPESVLAITWAALGTLLPSRSALGIALLTLESHYIGLDTPDDLMEIRSVSAKYPFGTTVWKEAVETVAKTKLKRITLNIDH